MKSSGCALFANRDFPVAVAFSVTCAVCGSFSPGDRLGASQYSIASYFGTIEAEYVLPSRLFLASIASSGISRPGAAHRSELLLLEPHATRKILDRALRLI